RRTDARAHAVQRRAHGTRHARRLPPRRDARARRRLRVPASVSVCCSPSYHRDTGDAETRRAYYSDAIVLEHQALRGVTTTSALLLDGHHPGLAAGVIARAVVERDRGPVGREGPAADDAARGDPVGVDDGHRAEVLARARVEQPQLVAVDDEGDAAAIGRPGDFTRLLRTAERLDRPGVVHVGADP